jgi:hypothetical protein
MTDFEEFQSELPTEPSMSSVPPRGSKRTNQTRKEVCL